jgi:hypothetical protein
MCTSARPAVLTCAGLQTSSYMPPQSSYQPPQSGYQPPPATSSYMQRGY